MIVLVICLLGGVICSLLAAGKQRSPVGWFVIGFLLPLIGLILAIVLPPGDGGLEVPPEVELAPAPAPARPARSALEELRTLADLKDRGALSEEEFAAKKRDLLARA